jgi:hypothetical protein
MIITKPKQSLYFTFNKSGDTKVHDKCPKKGIVFEIVSLTYAEQLEVSKLLSTALEDITKDENSNSIVEYTKGIVKAIHNFNFAPDQFQADTYLPLLCAVSLASRLSEEESYFFD